MNVKLLHGDCLERLKEFEDNSIDAIVTDPPYGISFMGRKWDYDVPSEDVWRECLRVLKPGGHLLAFAGTRTQHRMAVRIEDAGFEIRDMIAWVYGSGFPKSLDVGKAIDKAAGAEREIVGPNKYEALRGKRSGPKKRRVCYAQFGIPGPLTAPATEAAKQWNGWGTSLKPALEPITVARKPLDGTVMNNVLKHGTGAINVDGCRIKGIDGVPLFNKKGGAAINVYGDSLNGSTRTGEIDTTTGRWPTNFIYDGSHEPYELLHSAARFFYCAKASKADRDEGCEALEIRQTIGGGGTNDPNDNNVCGAFGSVKAPARNHHPTVKPTDLMRYLCRLVTPPGGTVLDPFMGSGSTGKAAVHEGFGFIGIERQQEYIEIAKARIENAEKQVKAAGRQTRLFD